MRSTWWSGLAVVLFAGLFAVACGPQNGEGTDGDDTGVESDDTDMGGKGDTDGNGGMDTDEGGETGTGDGGTTERFVVESCSEVSAATEVTVGPSLKYEPADATVPSGEVVQWNWADTVNQPHNVVADNDADCSEAKPGRFESDTTDDTSYNFCVRFNETGEWNYQCTVTGHCGGGMKGTITVE